jgi:fermentation-respiration switch protein FrsA (DUF1100 family)
MSTADEPTKANQALLTKPPDDRLKGPSIAATASVDETANAAEPSLARDAVRFAWYYLGRAGNLARPYIGGRRGLILLAIGVVGVGAWLNWGWLAAIGVAPILIALAPCAVMCALGLCAMGGKKSCSSEDTSPKPVARVAVPPKAPEDA